MFARTLLLSLTLLLAGCDLEALLADPKQVQKEADSKAIGAACRHGLRSIEDCYSLNEKASKAAIFAGWKDMDQYMRDNKIEGIAPQGLKPASAAGAVVDESSTEAPPAKDKADAGSKSKSKSKASDKLPDKSAG